MQPFTVNKDLRIGICISATLLKIYVTKAFEQWKKKCKEMGIQIDKDYCLNTLPLADGQVIYVNDYKNPEYIARKIKEEYGKKFLELNM